MSNYPAQIDNNQNLPIVIDSFTPVNANLLNGLRNAIVAVEQELGIKPSGTNSTVRARLDAIQNSLNNIPIIHISGDLGGTNSDPLVIGIWGRPISSIAPNFGQVLGWNGITWMPVNQTGGGSGVTFGGDLSGNSINQTVVGIRNIPISSNAPSSGQALLFNGTQWIASTNFGSQTVQTTGQLNSGPALMTSATTGLLELNGKLVTSALSSSLLSGSGQGIIYFDETAQQFLVSQSGSNYYPFVLNNTSTNFQTTGQINSGPILSTSLTTALLEITGKIVSSGVSTSYISGAGQGIIYFDSTQNQFLVSQNGSNYYPLTLNNTAVNFQTTGQINSGPLLATSVTTGLEILTGKFLVNAVSAPTLSNSGQGAIYFDSIQNEFLVSQNNSNYYPLVLNNTATNFQTTGQITSGPLLATSITTGLENLTGKFIVNAVSAPSISDTGQGIIYFDSTQNKFLVSENGSSYIPLTSSTTNVTTTTSNYNINSSDDIVVVGVLSSGITITLQASPSAGRVVTVKDAEGSAGAHNIIVSGNGNNIDGSSTYTLSVNYEAITIVYDGFGWSII